MSWKLEKGKTYIITVTLNWVESFAPDGMIVHKFTENGFSNVSIKDTDGGKERFVTGTWLHEDTIIPAESHLSQVLEIRHKK